MGETRTVKMTHELVHGACSDAEHFMRWMKPSQSVVENEEQRR